MKTIKLFCIAIMSLMFFTACENSSDELILDEELLQMEKSESLYLKNRNEVHKPFKADFYTNRDYSNEGVGFCTEDPYLAFNYQVGGGNATHLGNFTTTMGFCGSDLDYANGEGVFVAANGDELYIKIPAEGEIGHVLPLPYAHPLYEFYFQDPFSFAGGTGRFEGASGGGMTESYVDLFDDAGNFIPEHRTDHKWTGTLILPIDN